MIKLVQNTKINLPGEQSKKKYRANRTVKINENNLSVGIKK